MEKTTQKNDQKTEKWPENDQKTVEKTVEKSREKSTLKSTQKDTLKDNFNNETVEKILKLIKVSPHITAKELAANLDLSRRGIEEQIKSLKAKGIIRCVGPDKGGHWEIITQQKETI